MTNVRLHAVEDASRANGPGLRAVVWFQGCTLGCVGCFNPETHSTGLGFETRTEGLAARLLACSRALGLDGVSMSGGEPFQQPEALLDLLARLRAGGATSLLVFSGFTLEEIRRLPLAGQLLGQIDVLVAGRYDRRLPMGRDLLGSSNQRIHLLTPRHTPREFADIPAREIILHVDGTLTLSGVNPVAICRL